MILTVDIGNTNTHIGLYKNRKLVSHWQIKTQKNLNCDNYSVILKKTLPLKDLEGIVICSVVASLIKQFQRLFKKNSKLESIIVGEKLDLGIKSDYKKKELGADRIANAVGAYYLYKKGSIIVDLGTAITFDVVSPKGIYLGGAIAPGIGISSKALFSSTDLLKPINLKAQKFEICKNTTKNLQIGILHGFASMLDGMIDKFKKELNFKPLIILTGGDAERTSKMVNFTHIVNPFLTLEGLRIIYERNTHK